MPVVFAYSAGKPKMNDAILTQLVWLTVTGCLFYAFGKIMASILKFAAKARHIFVRKQAFANTVRMASYLIQDPKYSWLKDLGLDVENKGVFCGEWCGSGEVLFTFSFF